MNQLAFTLAGAVALSSAAAAQDPSADLARYDAKNVQYLGIYDPVTQTLSAPQRGAPGLGSPIYSNNAPTGNFFNCLDGRIIIDEGRVPGPTSTNVVGTQDSYGLTSLQIAYATNGTDPSLGGPGHAFQIKLYENFAPCGLLSSTDAELATIDITGLPASTSGGIAAFVLDVDISAFATCLRADGGDGYSDGTSDLFGWSFQVTDGGDATLVGPLIVGDPNSFPEGDGTVFQNPGNQGTGLDTQDLWRQINADGSLSCFFFGGYPTNVFGSYHLIVRSDLSGDCIGCGIGDDRFEPNDSQATAAPLALDSYSGLISDAVLDDDYYAVTCPPNEALVMDCLFIDAVSDLDLVLYDTNGAILDTGFSTTDDEQVVFNNCDANPVDLVLRVNNFSNICSEYDLVFSFDPLFADDSFEDNDDCASAVPLPLGSTEGLIIRNTCGTGGGEDSDFYSYTLADGDTLTVDILFIDAIADIDLILYDVSGGCNGTVVATGFSTTDNENASFTNTTGGPLDMVVRVDYFSGDSIRYDMRAKVGAATIGELLCLGNANSTGSGAQLCAMGSDVVADNDVTLEVTNLPLNAAGYFVVSQETIFIANPGGSMGDLCIGSLSIGRYAQNVLDSGATGSVSFSIDLTSIPFASSMGVGTVAAAPGDTFYWQHWTRDADPMGASTSNFSDAICITFN